MALPLRDDRARTQVPWVTLGLIAVNVIVFLFVQPSAFQPGANADRSGQLHAWQRADYEEFSYRYGTVPCEVVTGTPVASHPDGCHKPETRYLPESKSVVLALLTAIFLHGSLEHLGGNMLFLWVFGAHVEQRLGRGNFLALYLIGGILASLGFVAFHPHSAEPLIGASGAIAVAMSAYLVLVPRGRVLTVIATAAFQVVYVPAAVVLALFFATQLLTHEKGVAWEAHAVGMVVGAIAALVLSRVPAIRERGRVERADALVRAGQEF